MKIQNRINYIEFQARNLDAIKAFYAATFGWKFTDYGPEYIAFNDGSLEGGFAKGDTKSAGSPLVILYSENLEAAVESVKKNGGTIAEPIFSFPGGRRFHFADPSGNVLGIWSEK